MSNLKVNSITAIGTNNVLSVENNGVLYSPGSVIQTKQTVFTSTFSSSIGNGWASVTGLDCSITPIKSTSKILVMLYLCYNQQYYHYKIRLTRNGSVVTGAQGTQTGNRPQSWLTCMAVDNGASSATHYNVRTVSGLYLDSPNTTSALTYGIDIGGYSTSYAVYVNRGHVYTNSAEYDATPSSTLTLWEVAE
jgi:hypothetical protein